MNGLADALVRAATADVAANGIVDVGVGGVGFLGKQGDGGHDLSGLAVAALRNVFFHPGLLHGMAAVRRKAFDGGDFLARDAGNRGDAGTGGFAVDVHGTGSAERHAAAELGAGHIQGVTKHPEQRHVRADIDGLRFAVQGKTDGHGVLPIADRYPTTTPGWMKIRRIPFRPSADRRYGSAAAGCVFPSLQKWRWQPRAQPEELPVRRSRPAALRWARYGSP